MKIKRVLSAIIATVSMFSVCALGVSAIDEATYCFDTIDKISDWKLTEGSDAAGLKISINQVVAESGNGSLAIYESFRADPPNASTGIYVEAQTFGLENFAGYTMEISYKFDPDFKDAAENFSIFSDGIIWVQTNISRPEGKAFQKASVTVPENAANSRFGITIPTLVPTTGTIVYIDNVVIRDFEGNAIANVGDYKAAEETTGEKYTTTGILTTIIYVVLFIVIVMVIVLIIVYLVRAQAKRYR